MAQILKPEKRKAILNAARARFRKFGIKNTTMNDIADDSGLAVGNLYRYFPKKTEIIAACAEEFAETHRRMIDEIITSKAKSFTKLKKYVLLRFQASQNVRTGSDYVAEIARAVIEAKPDRLQDESNLFTQLVKDVLSQGVENGEFNISNIKQDTEVFCYAMAFFFPVAGNVVAVEPTVAELERVLDWFKEHWKP
ncbi:MAG: TetR/AcrR family transcriptional regulator, partial [Candidatus Obscuribacterales bacterium]|nr:TetR/AcrR family transcriptional regulator [Candidatus Obscuribacterales bacterium]